MPVSIWNTPARIANDVASVTLAGHTFAWAGMTGGPAGGILSLRIGLRGETLVGLARALARLEGVRVTSGPPIASRGDCFLVHCPGFKLVLSAPAPGDDFAPALVSRAVAPALAVTCELSQLLAGLMNAPTPIAAPASKPAPNRSSEAEPASPRTSTLRRSGLQPGKRLARKTPLQRKTPLGRGRGSKG
jgi:hypothetical protein